MALDLERMIAAAVAAEDAMIAERDAEALRRKEREKVEADGRAVAWFTSVFGVDLAVALAPTSGEGHGIQQAWFTYHRVTFIVSAGDSQRAGGVNIRVRQLCGNEPVAIGVPMHDARRSLLAFIGRHAKAVKDDA